MKNRKSLIYVAITFIVLISSIFIYKQSQFRVSGSTPSITGKIPTATNGFKIDFNREINTERDYSVGVVDPSGYIAEITNHDTYLLVRLSSNIFLGENDRFSINNIEARDGSIIESVVFDFDGVYVNRNDLSDEHIELINYFIEDSLPDIVGRLDFLPYDTLKYSLSLNYFEYNEESAEIGEPYILARIYLSELDVKIGKQKSIKAIKEDISNYLKSKGVSGEDITISYDILDP